jgi:aldehyde dehydrogenase (NAD+)
MSTIRQNYIDGHWVAGDTTVTNMNPSDLSDVIGEYARANVAQTEGAVAAARAAFASWGRSTPQERFDLLDRIGTVLLARREELGRLLSREEGKILSEGIGEVTRAGHIFKFFAGETLRMTGENVSSVRPGISVEVTREPLGVVALITPWNFPMAIPAWKIAPALAYGNCVVFKPAELVPGCAHALAEIIAEAGAPAGVFNLVMGKGSVVGETLVRSVDIDGISFTGSVSTGRAIAAKAIASSKKLQLEMGGKNPLVVLDDADLTVAVSAAINGAFFSTGQRCTASSRLIVTDGIHDHFVEAVTRQLSGLVVDVSLKPGTQIGPVVDQAQLDLDLEYLSIGCEEGAHLAFGGKRLKREHEGFYLEPALFVEAKNEMRICREEIFGPVAAVIRAQDYEEALAIANDTPFGLCAGICSTNLKFTTHFKRNSVTGMVMVNLPTAGVDYHVPFGGRKGSSYGPREQGSYASEFFTTVKTSYTLS